MRFYIFTLFVILAFVFSASAQIDRSGAERIAKELSAPQPMKTVVGQAAAFTKERR
jgi:hypothetical protein